MADKKKFLKWKEWNFHIPRAFTKIKIPALRLRYRLLLYLLTVIFGVLSLVQVIAEIFCFAVSIVIYVAAAVTLFVSCYYLMLDIRYGATKKVKRGIEAHAFTRRMAGDYRYRTVMFAVPGLMLNMVFALFNGVIGIYSRSAWYGTLSAYYILLSVMRFLAVRYDRRMQKEAKEGLDGKRLADEIFVYHRCGILFLVMTVALAGMVILMVNEEGGKSYPGFVIYAVAAYTFYKIVLSVINLIKVRKFQSPLLMAIRDIGHIDACVSILSLQTAMFASFGEGQEFLIKLMNGATGSVVCILVLCIGIYSVHSANKMKRKYADNTGGIWDD